MDEAFHFHVVSAFMDLAVADDEDGAAFEGDFLHGRGKPRESPDASC